MSSDISHRIPYCRSRPKDDKSRHFDPHSEEVRGGVEPWLMLVGKPVNDFLFVIIELFSLPLTVEAPQGKTCPDWLLLGEGR